MARVLAIESDGRQASILKRIVRDNVRADLIVVDSRDAAIAAITASIPDVILVTALLSPRDEEELLAHLRALGGAEHLQQLHTIPQLASGRDDGDGRGGTGLFGKLKKKRDEPLPGCDPELFADEIRSFLDAAEQAKAMAAANAHRRKLQDAVRPPDARATSDSAPGTNFSDFAEPGQESEGGLPLDDGVLGSTTGSAWASPFEWRKSDTPARPAAAAPTAASTLVTNVPLAVVADQALEQAEREQEERRRREAAERAEEERRRKEAAARAAEEAELERREAARAEEEARKRREAEARAAEEERKKKEAAARAEEDARKRREAEARAADEERKRKEAAARAAEEERRRKEAAARAEEERRRKEAAARAAEEERKRKEAEARAAEAERKRKEAEARAAEEERKRKEAAARAEEEARKRREAEARAAEEERKRKEAAARAAEEERKRKEAAARAEAERQRREAEARAAEEERRRREAEARAAEEERRRKEAEARAAEEERKRKEAAARAAEEARKRQEALARAEQERRKREEEERRRRDEEERKRREAAERAEEEARQRREAERLRLEQEAAAARQRAEEERQRKEAAAREAERLRREAEGAAARKREADAAAARQREHEEKLAARKPAKKGKFSPATPQPTLVTTAARSVPSEFAEFSEEYEKLQAGILGLDRLDAWARTEHRGNNGTPQPEKDALDELCASLSIPPHMASIGYMGGCRIRRVRVPSDPAAKPPAGKKGQPVILSRRALDDVRSPGR